MTPRIIIAALKGGSGKTILSLGLAAVLKEKGFPVATFKKGPDFIDAGWLSMASGLPCYNLDPFLMTETQILDSFLNHSIPEGIALIEGNRGLFDGLDIDGCCSTAELARLLKAPVLIILDVTMTTRTMAAVVRGCQVFEPQLNIAGVILNRVAGPRQRGVITESIMKYCGIPVVGSVPKLSENPFPERHMGLVPHQERERAQKAIHWAGMVVKENLQLDRILEMAQGSPPLDRIHSKLEMKSAFKTEPSKPKIGFIRDQSLWFYYPENLSALEERGAVLMELDAMSSDCLPDLDALYVGGGFPETQARYLADNVSFKKALKEQIEKGLPVYAECGGLIYLGERIWFSESSYPMVGALPLEFVFGKKPQGHGYTILETTSPNPYFDIGKTLRGHEFHYSKAVLTAPGDSVTFAFKVARGHGIEDGKDGILKKNVLGTYTHIHAAGEPGWANGLLRAALRFQKEKRNKTLNKSQKNI